MVEIIHVSDLHFGSEFKEEYFDNMINYIKNNYHDVVICSGDVVHKGRYVQYQKFMPLLECLKEASKRLMIIPGNHDAKNNGLIFFEKFIGPRRSKMTIEETKQYEENCLVSVKTLKTPAPQNLIQAITEIAKADKKFHEKEKQLLERVHEVIQDCKIE